MGVISDFDERLESILMDLGILKYFDFLEQSHVEGYSKPSAELYEAALKKAGTVDKAWHVGDDLEKDAFPGAQTILLDRKTVLETAHPKISTLTELHSLIQ